MRVHHCSGDCEHDIVFDHDVFDHGWVDDNDIGESDNMEVAL